MQAVLVTVGDELLIGQVVNTNAAWIGEQLNAVGVHVGRHVAVADDVDAIRKEVGRAYEEADLVVVTGGLGPTHDDLTRAALAECFGAELRFDEVVYERIRARYARRGRIPDSNRALAMVPEGFDVLPNPVGSAPGLWRRDEERERIVVVLPGVPQELRALVRGEVLPRLRRHRTLRVIEQRTLLTAGIGESSLQEQIGDVAARLDRHLRLAYLPGTSGVRLRLTATGNDRATVRERLNALERVLRERIGSYVYGTDDDTLEGIVGQMLAECGLTIATAESCTGGLLANRITDVPGASSYMVGGVVAYSNHVKIRELGVNEAVLEKEGAVSETVARQLARGARDRLAADIGVSTTGIAGPTGGTPEKPVGTVWIGYADAAGDDARLFHFVDDRLLNKELTCTAVLDLVRRRIRERREA